MAYKVDRFNGTFLVNVDDGSIDNTTDLRFVGKNYAGYGEIQNENFLHLLENFANISAPPRRITGQIWYDSLNKKLKYFDGDKFKSAGGPEVGSEAPAGLSVGDFWYDTSSNRLYAWSGNQFTLIGPAIEDDISTSSILPQQIKDNLGNNRSILKVIAGGDVIAIISKDAFTINNNLNPITGFSEVKKGITLINTNGTTGITSTDHFFWGTASNSLRLGGIAANQYITKSQQVFENEIRFLDPGFQVGNDNDLRIRITNGDRIEIESRLNNPINFMVSQGSERRTILELRNNGLIPGLNNIFDIGSNIRKWKDIHTTRVLGNLEGNVTGDVTGILIGDVRAPDGTIMINVATKQIGYVGAAIRGDLVGDVEGNLKGTADDSKKLQELEPSIQVPTSTNKTSIVTRNQNGEVFASAFKGISDKSNLLRIDNSLASDGNYFPAKTTKDGNTIAARNGDGNIAANIFDGTATAARYADLAEKYLPDADYPVGTVVMVGGSAEITKCIPNSRAIGVISANPAFMMNKDLDGGVYVALKGRVPVLVWAPVTKGSTLIAADDGYATEGKGLNVFAISLEDNEEIEPKLVECVIL
jgi:hypothetical protein